MIITKFSEFIIQNKAEILRIKSENPYLSEKKLLLLVNERLNGGFEDLQTNDSKRRSFSGYLKRWNKEKITNESLFIKGESILTDKEGNVKLKWTKTAVDKEQQFNLLKEAFDEMLEGVKPYKPQSKTLIAKNTSLLNQYTITDFHLGMMSWAEETGEAFDLKIAEKLLIDWFEAAIEQSPKASTAIFANIGDFLHWDGLDAVTPMNKHVLDADSRFPKLVRLSIKVIRQIITMLLNKYDDVHLIMAEGNHDLASSVWLRETFKAFYENEPRLTVDNRPDPYYCYRFGKTCLFYHHGHKRNPKNIDTVFVSKFKHEFGASENVYAHLGHLHNQQTSETNLMIIEQHRTLAASDAYASRGGWLSGRDSKVITYHKRFGEVSRVTINPKMLK